MRFLLPLLASLALAGCVTPAGRQAASDVAAETEEAAKNGCPPADPAMIAAAREADGVRRQVGGEKLPGPRSAEAMNATALQVESDIALWEQVKGWAEGLIPRIPYIGGALATALAAWKTWQSLRRSRLAGKALETAGVFARGAASGKSLPEIFAEEAPKLEKVSLVEVRKTLEDAQGWEI